MNGAGGAPMRKQSIHSSRGRRESVRAEARALCPLVSNNGGECARLTLRPVVTFLNFPSTPLLIQIRLPWRICIHVT
jgi:hypothetical protein